MNPVIIGIAPGREGWEGQPLSAIDPRSTGRRIAEMAGLDWALYMRVFDRINICPFSHPGTINPKEWTSSAENLAGSILQGRRVIMLGPNVAESFGLRRADYEFCVWNEAQDPGFPGYRVGLPLPFHWAVIPHPSGRNFWYNDPGNKAMVEKFLKEEITE